MPQRLDFARSRRICLRVTAAVCAAFVAFGDAAAAASDLTPPLRPDFSVLVHGSVPPLCALTDTDATATFENPQSAANTTRADIANIAFDIDCNTGFVVRMSSANGALVNPKSSPGGMFATAMAYRARVELPTNLGGPECLSTAMRADGKRCAQIIRSQALPDGVLKGTGNIALTLVADGRPLLAGEYIDFLEITVTPLLGGADGGT